MCDTRARVFFMRFFSLRKRRAHPKLATRVAKFVTSNKQTTARHVEKCAKLKTNGASCNMQFSPRLSTDKLISKAGDSAHSCRRPHRRADDTQQNARARARRRRRRRHTLELVPLRRCARVSAPFRDDTSLRSAIAEIRRRSCQRRSRARFLTCCIDVNLIVVAIARALARARACVSPSNSGGMSLSCSNAAAAAAVR